MVMFLLIVAILATAVYIGKVHYVDYNYRQRIIVQQYLRKIVTTSSRVGEEEAKMVVLINLAIDTYNEGLRGPSIYTKRLEIPHHELADDGEGNETEGDPDG